ncbi:hypothetical protein WAI453_005877 [Rhynchosporium graminicola]|uniref:Uncharacterized protein n=1 Tax=Rhynchosporium graminicola TaxID=2792576 RepID=A0A1E1LRG5_9HELO|nr:uncharacterized protein RCO7_04245 [Rhynchosporium commune]
MPNTTPKKWKINGKSLTAPLAAFTMATLLFIYARTSIQAAKRNAQRTREADGGQINWHNETLRRHGKLDVPGEGSTVGELVSQLKGGKEGLSGGGDVGEKGETMEEKMVRERRRAG